MSAVTALIKKRRWYWKNNLILLCRQSMFKVIFILVFGILFETGLFAMFIDGFRWLDSFGGMGAMIVTRLFSLFFLGMCLMLILSSVVTTYSTVFRSGEIAYLMTKPMSLGGIVAYKFMESTRLSSWAFFFIVIPFVGSYAWHQRLSPMFAVWTLIFSIPFLVVCSGIGSIITFTVLRWYPQNQKIRKGIIAIIMLLTAAGVIVLAQGSTEVSQSGAFRIARLVPGLKLATYPLIPSWWVSEGIMAFSRALWLRGIMLLGLTSSSAMLIYFIIDFMGNTIFYECWQRQVSQQGSKKRAPIMLSRTAESIRGLPGDIRGMAMKDIRSFFRDPMQWSQALVFFGLLAIYFANLRSFNYQAILPNQWLNTISFINVFSVSAVLTSLGSRFVYPQLSLEGQGFWLLGLSPTSMGRIVMTKFLMSTCAMLAISVFLIWLSTHMMNSENAVRAAAMALAAAISLAVSGLSTGLGAIFIDLEERNPAAIVSGFGGTLNLAICLGFMLLAIAPFAVVFHANTVLGFPPAVFSKFIGYCSIWLIALTLSCTAAPLAMGIISLNNRDY